jgi:Ribonuclease G/E
MIGAGRRLLINALPGERRMAWLEDGRLEDLVIRRDDRPNHLGDIYLGRVLRLDKGLDAAFVEIGLPRPGFLPLGEAPGRKVGDVPGRKLSEGDRVVVKVRREPAGDKGARLTARIADPPPALEAAAGGAKPPALLSPGDDPLRRLTSNPPDDILVDDVALFGELKARFAVERPALVPRLALHADPIPLFEAEAVEPQIDALLLPRVALPSGGSLLIEPVETLTAIDVNSGGHGGRGGARAQGLEVDLEAVPVLARQLRLRALSGLIVIDFLELEAQADRKRVTAALKAALAADPEPARVFAMAPSGLTEMTRRRGRPPLHEMLTRPCGLGGSGRVKDPVTLAFEALRRARHAAAGARGRALTIAAAPAVAAALEGPAAAARADLAARLGLELAVAPDPAREEPEIVVG